MVRLFWEMIDADTYRAKVPGGWLVRYNDLVTTTFMDTSYQIAIKGTDHNYHSTITFIADPDHGWDLEQLLGIQKNAP
jgi:hypothetical protein